jgi:hypothetical protein
LYARRWDGVRLGEQEYVISSDEKTSIQARCRCHPTLPPGTSRTMRVEHEYDRGGALAYLAAYDVHPPPKNLRRGPLSRRHQAEDRSIRIDTAPTQAHQAKITARPRTHGGLDMAVSSPAHS